MCTSFLLPSAGGQYFSALINMLRRAGPQCSEWKHWETGAVYQGGQTTEVVVPYDSPAAFKCATRQ